jgi:glycosyltransferase involved in cell wall biosynthesis
VEHKISVIIPTYNSEKELKVAIDALFNQSIQRKFYEIIVVDDGSTDNTHELVNQYDDIVYLYQVNAGSYAARNLGISQCRSELIAFIDADCIPHEYWLERLIEQFQADPSLGVIMGRIDFIFDNVNRVVEVYDANFHMLQEYYAKVLQCGATANMSVRRSVVDRIGGFDQSLRSGGDMEFSKKAKNNNIKIDYSKNAIICHPTRKRFRELYVKRERVLRGVMKRYPSFNQRFGMMFIRPLNKVHHKDWFRIKLEDMSFSLRYRFYLLYYFFEVMRSYIVAGAIIKDALTTGKSNNSINA